MPRNSAIPVRFAHRNSAIIAVRAPYVPANEPLSRCTTPAQGSSATTGQWQYRHRTSTTTVPAGACGARAPPVPALQFQDEQPARLDAAVLTMCNDTSTRVPPDRAEQLAEDWRAPAARCSARCSRSACGPAGQWLQARQRRPAGERPGGASCLPIEQFTPIRSMPRFSGRSAWHRSRCRAAATARTRSPDSPQLPQAFRTDNRNRPVVTGRRWTATRSAT
jgi:hypothetical protein